MQLPWLNSESSLKTQPLKVMFDGKNQADEVWMGMVTRESSHEQAAAFLQRRCGYPESKARAMAGAQRNILKTERPMDKLARAWQNFKMGRGS